MNLPRDFHKAARWIQVLAGFVLRHRFDHGVGQTFAAEIIQRVLDEPALARQMAEEGPRYVQSEWNLDDAIKRLETKLFELLGEGPRPRHVDEDKLVSSASVTT